jgi:hypothetical protein
MMENCFKLVYRLGQGALGGVRVNSKADSAPGDEEAAAASILIIHKDSS